MKTKQYITKYSRIYTLYPFEDESAAVIISQRNKINSISSSGSLRIWETAKVNWPAFGDTNEKRTADFAAALSYAAGICETYNRGIVPHSENTEIDL
jgi:hypothetical protein